MAAGKAAVEESLYCHSLDNGLKFSDACIISAHGALVPNSSFIVPQPMTLFFYSPAGASVRSVNVEIPDGGWMRSDILGVLSGDNQPVDRKNGGDRCEDYTLAKLEKSEGSVVAGRSPSGYDDLQTMLAMSWANRPARIKDIITIRNRRGLSNPTLSYVLNRLMANNRTYAEVHCIFCRIDPRAFHHLPPRVMVPRSGSDTDSDTDSDI